MSQSWIEVLLMSTACA